MSIAIVISSFSDIDAFGKFMNELYFSAFIKRTYSKTCNEYNIQRFYLKLNQSVNQFIVYVWNSNIFAITYASYVYL